MSVCTLSFTACATGPDLQLRVRHNGQVLFEKALDSALEFHTEFTDHDDHCLEIDMMGKLPGHTVIDNIGNIVSDRVIKLDNIALDGLELGQLFYDLAEYTHNFNDTQDPITEKFYGIMGCNGTVKLNFSSPVYLWLLENM